MERGEKKERNRYREQRRVGLPREIIEWKSTGLGTSSMTTFPSGRDFLMPKLNNP